MFFTCSLHGFSSFGEHVRWSCSRSSMGTGFLAPGVQGMKRPGFCSLFLRLFRQKEGLVAHLKNGGCSFRSEWSMKVTPGNAIYHLYTGMERMVTYSQGPSAANRAILSTLSGPPDVTNQTTQRISTFFVECNHNGGALSEPADHQYASEAT